MPLYVNRKTRVRHVDPNCHVLRYSRRLLDHFYDHDPERKPTARILELPDPTDPREVEAIRDFTRPCILCVPGACASAAALPFEFEDPDEYEPYDDDEGDSPTTT